MAFDPARDYPLGAKRPDLVATPAGVPLGDVTLKAALAGALDPQDVRATGETLRRQAAIALASGRPQLAESLERAAELVAVPAEAVLEIYTALRPRRSTAEALETWAGRLERDFGAPLTAAWLREALAVYEQRGLLALADERVDAAAV